MHTECSIANLVRIASLHLDMVFPNADLIFDMILISTRPIHEIKKYDCYKLLALKDSGGLKLL